MKRATHSRLKKLARSEKGLATIEFAFIAPIFLLLMSVMLETGLMAFTEYVLQSGVQRAAREVKVGIAQNSSYSAADFKNKICTLAGIIIDCNKVYVYLKPAASVTALHADLSDPYNIGPSYSGGATVQNFTCGGPKQFMALVASYDWKFNIPYFMEPLGNVNGNKTRRLLGISTFQNEPFPQTGACS
jgi:Flp pilus assembly protein TadG